MLAKRIIPCLDVCDGRVVKGVNFVNLRDAGDPVEVAKIYQDQGADELVFLDITASHEKRRAFYDVIKETAKECFMPLTVGGGMHSLQDMQEALRSGADKVSLNSAVLKNPNLINEAAKSFGSQCVVVAIDVRRTSDGRYEIYSHGGRYPTGRYVDKWCPEVEERGAGELLITSMDCDVSKTRL